MCVCGCGCVRLHPSILHTTAGRVPAARAAGGEFVRAFRRLRGEGRRSVALPGLFPVRGRRGEEDEVDKIVGDRPASEEAYRNCHRRRYFTSNWRGIGYSFQLAITAPLYSITGYCIATAQS